MSLTIILADFSDVLTRKNAEIMSALRNMKRRKSTGDDGIATDILKDSWG